MKRMLLVLWIGALAMPVLITSDAARAGVGHGRGSCESRCPTCDKICRAEVVPTKEKKTTWDVECEDICIPAITFPWQKCCQPRCGKVITVNRLKKIEYECESCGCKWSIESLPCDCGNGHENGLGYSGNDEAGPSVTDAGATGSGFTGTRERNSDSVGLPGVKITTPDRYSPATSPNRGAVSADYFRFGPPLPEPSR